MQWGQSLPVAIPDTIRNHLRTKFPSWETSSDNCRITSDTSEMSRDNCRTKCDTSEKRVRQTKDKAVKESRYGITGT